MAHALRWVTVVLASRHHGLDDGGFDFLGKELDDNARIWNVYRDEITADDKAHGFELWLQTLDILLIFAGLFSAVVTAFLIDSYKLLQKPDPNDFIAAALYALVVATNNSALLVDLPKPRPLSSVPSNSERWVNALWFTSLVIALAVALLAILAKQWLQEFHRRLADSGAAGSTPTPSNEWTRKRWFYLRGMTQTWPMDGFITYLLPFMLHIALFLFLAGLSLFLWSVDDIVSRIVLALTAFIIAFYVACTLLPLWCPDAPTSTPLLKQLLAVVHTVPTSLLHMSIAFCKFLEKFETPNSSSAQSLPSPAQTPSPAAYSLVQGQRNRLEGTLVRLQKTKDPSVVRPESPDERNRRLSDVLTWLIVSCTNENAVMIGFQGVGALDIDSEVIPRLREATVGMSALAHFGSNKTPSTLDAIRAIRSELVLGRGSWQSTEIVLNVPAPMLTALTDTHYPTAILLRSALGGHICSFDRLIQYVDWTSEYHVSSLASTSRLLLRCKGTLHFDVLTELLPFLDYTTLSLQDYDRILSLCPDHTDTITHGDAADRCVATLLHVAASVDYYGPSVTRAIWRLMPRVDHNATAHRLERHLDTLEDLFSRFPKAVFANQPRPDLCAYARQSTVNPVLAMYAAMALLQSHLPPIRSEQRVDDETVFKKHLPVALEQLLRTEMTASQSHSAHIHQEVWVKVLKQTIHPSFCHGLHDPGHYHSMAASLSWLDRRKIVPNTVLDDLTSRLWKAISHHLSRQPEDKFEHWPQWADLWSEWRKDTSMLHLAQHFRELFCDWRQRRVELEKWDNPWRAFFTIVDDAKPCTECPGTPPARWPDEPETASATVPSPAAQQDSNVPSIAASETTSSVALAVSLWNLVGKVYDNSGK
ncbi:hypothetical protein EXIGLDRAFT_700782 [Exidia glandulosa HHB12029]|uniref:DUF6535 domain-containing protein n=1 Tax=Exidia glandulosa HHB12029 TaxID=1314781 RepID=A0A165LZD6_EXIGL|nr:hypothetical protein EXIGLDRAFT_700782 [Exidia glandulosa HHB12029]